MHRSSRRRWLAHGAGLAAGVWAGERLLAAAVADAPPLNVCLISGSVEYESDESLAAFQEYLEGDRGESSGRAVCSRAFRKADDDLPGLENLETCDVMLLFTRRLTISGEQLDRVKAYCQAGRPLVAVRTASHAFQNWLELDKEILGGNYKGHYDEGPKTKMEIAAGAAEHPILDGFEPFESKGSLYRNTGLSQDVKILLTGVILDHSEPLAWTREHNGGRIFYTSLGHPADFAEPAFRELLARALFWAAM